MQNNFKPTLSVPVPLPQREPDTEDPYHYAGFWIRFAATFIDAGIFVLIALLFSTLLSITNFSVLTIAGRFLSMAPIFGFLFLLLNVYFIRRNGTTLGKRAAGIKIVFEEGDATNVWKILLRELVGKLVSGLLTLNIGYFMAAFTARKRALHDMIAKTVVVYESEDRKFLAGALAVLSFIAINAIYFSLFMGALVSGFMSATKSGNQVAPTPPSNAAISSIGSIPTEVQPESLEGAKKGINEHEEVYPGSASFEKNTKQDEDIYEYINESISLIKQYEEKFGSYKNLKDGLTNHTGLVTGCGYKTYNNRTNLDVSPDGKKFVIHQKLCTDPSKSYCYDENSIDITIVETELVSNYFKCK